MNSSFENNSATNTPQKKLVRSGPKTRVCYVCGRQYGIHSFEIHLKQCKELWIAREAEKDPRDRKKLPEDPMLRLSINESNENIIAGTISSSSKNTSSTMNNKTLDELNRLATVTFNNEAMETCKYCLRTFLTEEKLIIHNRSCTIEKPARKITDSVNRRPNYINNNNSSNSNILCDSLDTNATTATSNGTSITSTSNHNNRPSSRSNMSLSPSKLTRGNSINNNSLPRSNNNNLSNTIVDNNNIDTSLDDINIIHLKIKDNTLQQQQQQQVYHDDDRINLSSPHKQYFSGNAGRSLRKSASPTITTTCSDTETIFNIDSNINNYNIDNNIDIDSINTKDEILTYLSNEVDRMEKLSLHLVQSIANVKQIIIKLE